MTTDTVQNNGAPEAAPVMAPPRVRMDRTRSFSTIHGDRGPSDPHYGMAYRQDGIPCDAEGYFMFDHPDMRRPGRDGDHARKMAEKHIARALKQAAKAPPPKPAKAADDEDFDGDEAEGLDAENEDDDLLPPVSLGAWLRGDQEATWNDVSQEIARTYKKRIAKTEDAVAFLVKEGVCPKAELRPKFKKWAD